MKPDQLIIVKLVKNNRFSLLMEKPCPVIIKLGVTNFTVKNNTFRILPLCCLFASLKSRVKEENLTSNVHLLIDQSINLPITFTLTLAILENLYLIVLCGAIITYH